MEPEIDMRMELVDDADVAVVDLIDAVGEMADDPDGPYFLDVTTIWD